MHCKLLLHCAITFSFIYFCDSVQSTLGSYKELVFSQRAPGTAYYYLQPSSLREASTSDQVLEFLEHFWPILIPDRWFIQELRPIRYLQEDSITIFECVNDQGQPLLYSSDVPPLNFRMDLSTDWPGIYGTDPVDIMWQIEYDTYGSCINASPEAYFTLARTLLHNYNVGTLLRDANIEPGTSYDLDHIINSLKTRLGGRPYVKCLQDENSPKQYIFEVQICFNFTLSIIDCHCYVMDHCVFGMPVSYPGTSNNQ